MDIASIVEHASRRPSGDPISIVEAMTMEFSVHAQAAGHIGSGRCRQGPVFTTADALAASASGRA